MSIDADIIYGLSTKYLAAHYDNPQPTPAFHEQLWDLCCSDHRQVAIAAPRSHSKSTAVTVAYTLTAVLTRERKYPIILSNTEEQAILFLNTIKDILKFDKKLATLFKFKKFVKDKETDCIGEFLDGTQFKIQAMGSGAKVRGRNWRGKRPDLVIADDLESDEQVMNQDRRRKFKEWFYGAVIPALSDDGIIRVVGTILHLDSLLERLMPENQLPEGVDKSQYLIHEPLSVSSTYDAPGIWHSIRFRAHDPDFEHILWPERFPRERLEALRNGYVMQGFPEGYAQEYLNYPIDEGTAYFKSGDMRDIRDKAGQRNYYIGTDFAVTEKNKADWSVFAVAGMTSDGTLQVTDVRRKRMDALEIIEHFFELQSTYNPDYFVVEKGTIWNAIKPSLMKRQGELGIYLSTKELPATADKTARARSLQARMRAGRVEFNREAYWYSRLEDEFLTFPRGKHDDQVDALAYLALSLQTVYEASTPEEIMEEEWEEDMANFGFGMAGANPITGY